MQVRIRRYCLSSVESSPFLLNRQGVSFVPPGSPTSRFHSPSIANVSSASAIHRQRVSSRPNPFLLSVVPLPSMPIEWCPFSLHQHRFCFVSTSLRMLGFPSSSLPHECVRFAVSARVTLLKFSIMCSLSPSTYTTLVPPSFHLH